ncbi:MAG: hypothetical protein QW156_05000 [Candidatus Aenigmatarchaeota archaeon]
MKKYNTQFENLILSYSSQLNLDDNVVEKTLYEYAKKWGGCIACQYSIAPPDFHIRVKQGNIWLMRGCQLGLHQSSCSMFKPFPK